ncbi:MAG TPA: hypothetical protein VN963_01010, partial [bacterium]|nr:hypothetical protein [bacterium]
AGLVALKTDSGLAFFQTAMFVCNGPSDHLKPRTGKGLKNNGSLVQNIKDNLIFRPRKPTHNQNGEFRV